MWTWHEAADTRRFHPPEQETERQGLVWIGNWGDGERTEELQRFLLAPAREAGLSLDICGVRYPREALAMLERFGASYRGWAPNAQAPEIFAIHLATVHVPRRYYASTLPGIPTMDGASPRFWGRSLVKSDCGGGTHPEGPQTDTSWARGPRARE